jgi:hypothetical protein
MTAKGDRETDARLERMINLGGMGWVQAQAHKVWFEKMEKEGYKVIIVDPKSERRFSNPLTFGKAGRGKAIRGNLKKTHLIQQKED